MKDPCLHVQFWHIWSWLSFNLTLVINPCQLWHILQRKDTSHCSLQQIDWKIFSQCGRHQVLHPVNSIPCVITQAFPAITRHWLNVGLMLGRRRPDISYISSRLVRHWANTEPALYVGVEPGSAQKLRKLQADGGQTSPSVFFEDSGVFLSHAWWSAIHCSNLYAML